jgi:Uri superfamily endonuclease
MDLPADKGTYILISSVAQLRRWEIGSLGKFELIPGFNAYVGSAFGAGGLRARMGHHLAATAEPHWHIDYLLQLASPVEVWDTTSGRKLEHHWAEFLEAARRFCVPIPRFGASDYHRSRRSHLFYSKRRPSFPWFRRQMLDGFEDLEVERFTVLPPSAPVGRAGCVSTLPP